jgi:alpha-beta hydrolase superfamily lysophospholipase
LQGHGKSGGPRGHFANIEAVHRDIDLLLNQARERYPGLPLLIMHGMADSIALQSSSMEFAAALDGNCKLVLWEDAYHELHNETNKVEVLKTMTDWIGAHLS